MTFAVHFHIDGEAVAKGRPKFSQVGGFVRTYTPKKTSDYESRVREAAQAVCKVRAREGGQLLEGQDMKDDDGYYCVVCGRFIEAVDGVIVHDDIPHPPDMTFDEEENPQ